MPLYSIAGLIVQMQPIGKTLLKQSEKYLTDTAKKPDITININNPDFANWQNTFKQYSYDNNEYSWFGYDFYKQILEHNGFFFHSSAISINGEGIVFSANSGTGKSTHSALWCENFGKDSVTVINDDKPAIIEKNGLFYVYGTPFSGKTDTSANIGVPLKAICFLERSEVNWIKQIKTSEALPLFFSQTLREKNIDFMNKLITLADNLLKTVKIYKMGCNISKDAVITAYNKIIKGE